MAGLALTRKPQCFPHALLIIIIIIIIIIMLLRPTTATTPSAPPSSPVIRQAQDARGRNDVVERLGHVSFLEPKPSDNSPPSLSSTETAIPPFGGETESTQAETNPVAAVIPRPQLLEDREEAEAVNWTSGENGGSDAGVVPFHTRVLESSRGLGDCITDMTTVLSQRSTVPRDAQLVAASARGLGDLGSYTSCVRLDAIFRLVRLTYVLRFEQLSRWN